MLKRILVCDVAGADDPPQPLRMVNPVLVRASAETETAQEGCLSLPDQYADVTRPAAVTVSYLDAAGSPQELTAEGLLARCVQHEMDHLDGVLFTDHVSTLKRNIIMRKLAKWKKGQSAA